MRTLQRRSWSGSAERGGGHAFLQAVKKMKLWLRHCLLARW
jgi:hypothetical protein